MKKVLILIFFMVFIIGCIQQSQDKKQQAITLCMQICRNKPVGTSIEEAYKNGPCLSDNEPNWNIEDWVCDIAHSPRQPIDDLPENQCQAYRNGSAHHFVELDTSCNLIKVI